MAIHQNKFNHISVISCLLLLIFTLQTKSQSIDTTFNKQKSMYQIVITQFFPTKSVITLHKPNANFEYTFNLAKRFIRSKQHQNIDTNENDSGYTALTKLSSSYNCQLLIAVYIEHKIVTNVAIIITPCYNSEIK